MGPRSSTITSELLGMAGSGSEEVMGRKMAMEQMMGVVIFQGSFRPDS
ncbi:hypothetical protein [Methanothrix sp.]|jgi:hypothetical protein